MSAAAETSRVPQVSKARAAETRRNANALKYLKPVRKVVATMPRNSKDIAPVTEQPVPVRWEQARRQTARATPADQARDNVRVAVEVTKGIAQQAEAQVSAQEAVAVIVRPRLLHVLN